jgi:hypothetical protein
VNLLQLGVISGCLWCMRPLRTTGRLLVATATAVATVGVFAVPATAQGSARANGGRSAAAAALWHAATAKSAQPAAAAPTAAAGLSTLTVPDASGDTTPSPEPRADIVSASIDYWRDAITVSLDVSSWTNPSTDATWTDPNSATGAAWGLDVNADGAADYLGVLTSDGEGGIVGAVLNSALDPLCNGDGVATSPGYRLSFPAGCIGSPSPSSVAFIAVMTFGTTNPPFADRAPDTGTSAPVIPSTEAHSSGGFVTDDWGGLQPFHTGALAPPAISHAGPYWPGKDVVRGNAATFGAGYVVDDWGGIHPYKLNAPSNVYLGPDGGPYWEGKDVARGIALLPDGTGGYVLDDWGGLHPFSLGASALPPGPQGGPYWVGQDVARGVAILPDGSGGYIVDTWGALHPFVIPGQGHAAPGPPTDGPYWRGQDVARGVVADAEGNGGYVLDDWGGLHPFSIPGTTGPVPTPNSGPYWKGQNVARGLSVVPQDPT